MNFSSKIIDWYHLNKRELPWRQEVNPYYTWLSEVMLQQTRVSQGLPYFLKFINRYPTITDLANAPEERVLKDWQGLGYYSRARNMHLAARIVARDFNGRFPVEFNEILMLPGVGPYTAAAIASICYNGPYPVVDGNVQRVIARIFGVTEPVNSTKGKRQIEEVVQQVFDKENAGDFNQAIMEFGALQCKPQNPSCGTCIFIDQCHAYKYSKVNELPLKLRKASPTARHFIYIVPQLGNYEYVIQRTQDDIWKNLFEFPLTELKSRVKKFTDSQAAKIIYQLGLEGDLMLISPEFKHVLTHRIIYARFITVKLKPDFRKPSGWRKKPINDHSAFAFPVLIQKFLDQR